MTNIDTAGATTQALRRVLAGPVPQAAIADLLFLEAWERDPSGHAGATLRAGQIRRANPALAAEIRAEVQSAHKLALLRRQGFKARPNAT